MDKEERFHSIYKSYAPMLRIIAKSKGIPVDEIEDLVQDTFASYYSHYPLEWEEKQIKAALIRIMKNLCVDYYRRRDARPVVYCDPVSIEENAISAGRQFARDNLSILLERQEYDEVVEVLRGMKEDWAKVFVLYVIEGRPMDEVSRMLGISSDACRARLSRGRKYLRECMFSDSPEEYRAAKKSKPSSLAGSPRELPEGI